MGIDRVRNCVGIVVEDFAVHLCVSYEGAAVASLRGVGSRTVGYYGRKRIESGAEGAEDPLCQFTDIGFELVFGQDPFGQDYELGIRCSCQHVRRITGFSQSVGDILDKKIHVTVAGYVCKLRCVVDGQVDHHELGVRCIGSVVVPG